MKAQIVADSSYFVKHASYLTDITPGNFTGVFKRISDSMVNMIPTPLRDYTHCSAYSATVDERKPADTVYSCMQLHWDKQLRLVEVKSGKQANELPFEFKAFYAIGMKPLFYILNDSTHDRTVDTATYHYGNNGMITSVTYHYQSFKHDSTFTETRLYDKQNRLVVDQNVMYGGIRGLFTYEYNLNNQVISRRFLLAAGSGVLATDTLIYSTDSLKGTTIVVHELKAGNGNWVKLDEMESRADGKPVMYSCYFNGADISRYQVGKNVRLQIEYDPNSSKRLREIRENTYTGEAEELNYVYGEGIDSLKYYTYSTKDRKRVDKMEKTEVRKYVTGTSLLESKTTITYSSYFRKKRINYRKERTELVSYKWSN